MYTQSRPTVPGFQSTFLQEERQFLSFASGSYFYFQSTLLQEERLQRQVIYQFQVTFNPRSYKRSDRRISLVWSAICGFQSTLLQEERQGSVFIGKRGRAFNPRSYKRSDHIRTVVTARYATFNPRSYKRSDENQTASKRLSDLSIHAPTRGAT